LGVNHLFRDYVRRQTRRLALRNDLTPGQPKRIVSMNKKNFTSEGTTVEKKK
jgi:hypothetical protein